MHASRLSRRAVLARTAAAAALSTVPPLQGRAHAAGVTATTPSCRWRNAVIGGTGFITGVLFHPAVRGLAYAQAWAGNGAVLRSEDHGATWTRTDLNETITAVHRSDDAAGTWVRIDDDAHQWGWIGEVITADPRVYGRVYLGTNGRGIQYGEPV
ncbi:hypothetical protein ACFY3M_24020 [Streptomyces mirabilis]|uniref:hypothetical protein n=1 Tax=Streptomyces mirabilis TaxID=68239 RepID=UPI0036C70FFC